MALLTSDYEESPLESASFFILVWRIRNNIQRHKRMMDKRKEFKREKLEMVGIDQLVSKDHLLRKVDAIDFNTIYEYVEEP